MCPAQWLSNSYFVDRSLVTFRRQIKKNKSVIQLLLFNEQDDNDIKSKNIKQTEILVDLREAILQVNCQLSKLDHSVKRPVCIVGGKAFRSTGTQK